MVQQKLVTLLLNVSKTKDVTINVWRNTVTPVPLQIRGTVGRNHPPLVVPVHHNRQQSWLDCELGDVAQKRAWMFAYPIEAQVIQPYTINFWMWSTKQQWNISYVAADCASSSLKKADAAKLPRVMKTKSSWWWYSLRAEGLKPVSYTHLTLPTKLSV